MKEKSKLNFASIAAQDNFPADAYVHPHSAPVFLSSTYVYESPEKAQEVFKGKKKAFIYSRWSHPNAELVERKLEEMETFGMEKVECRALLFSSGMAAISALFQSVIKPGDSLLVQGNIYGTSVDYVNHIAQQFGLKVYYEDFKNFAQLEKILKADKKIKLLYAETPSNPTLECYDLKALSALAHQYKTKIAVDNTFASPYLQRPFEWGVDFVVHSSTKFLNGHGTGLSGVVLGRDLKFMDHDVWKVRKIHGSICAPFDAWMLNVGMKTLAIRMQQHGKNAKAVAEFLLSHKAIAKVSYLGLKQHPDHVLAKKQMADFGGVLSFELKGGYKAGEKLMKKLKLCQLTASLGTIDTLIQHPASMSHYFVPKAQREKYGITDGLVRLSVGIEDIQDIIGDLTQALKAL